MSRAERATQRNELRTIEPLQLHVASCNAVSADDTLPAS
jgi:hypothetical protein